MRTHLGVSHLWFVNNGTTALQIALKALDLKGEVITTPFSYVATTGAILWENLTPVFVDIRPGDLTLDPAKIEAAITPRTSAILATHVYGFPCDTDTIATLARRHGLRVIYDAAHAFGCTVDGRSLAAFGDISCLSFHATKPFHTIEGGAVVINGNPELAERVRLMRAFGHHGDTHYCLGINGKNSELHAAMGLCNLPRLPELTAQRAAQIAGYRQLLASVPQIQNLTSGIANFRANGGYCPILLPNEPAVLRALASLAAIGVHPRRYFHPALNRLPYLAHAACPVAESAAARVLCLPISDRVTPALQEQIVDVLTLSLG